MRSMKAAVFEGPNQPLYIKNVPIPEISPEEILVEVKACGICGSDVHYIKGETVPGKIPIILGHECTGIIAKVGHNITELKENERVVIDCVTSCGDCKNCQKGRDSICLNRKLTGISLDGALAQYIKVKKRNIISLPEEISFEQGALATDAVATPYHALKTRGKLKIGESIAIFGLGGLGLHALKVARAIGASPIIGIDISKQALRRAKDAGADIIINSMESNPVDKILDYTDQTGVDLAFECVGRQQTVARAAEAVCVGGRVVVVGLGPDMLKVMSLTEFVRKEVSIIGSSAFEIKEIEEILQLMKAGRLDLTSSISKTIDLEHVNDALNLMIQSPGSIIRTIINKF